MLLKYGINAYLGIYCINLLVHLTVEFVFFFSNAPRLYAPHSMPTCLPLVVPGRRHEHEIPSRKFAPFAKRLVDKNEKETLSSDGVLII